MPAEFVLYRGTALALRLGHRTSVDFDFFSTTPFEGDVLRSHIAFLRDLPLPSFAQCKRNTVTAVIDREGSVQVSFFGGLKLNRVHDPDVTDDSVQVASLLDLAGTKAGTIYSRVASKDYLDLHALIEYGFTLETILGAASAVYGPQFNPELTLRAMTYFEDLEGPPLSDEQRRVLSRAAASVQLARIPIFTSRQGLSISGERDEHT